MNALTRHLLATTAVVALPAFLPMHGSLAEPYFEPAGNTDFTNPGNWTPFPLSPGAVPRMEGVMQGMTTEATNADVGTGASALQGLLLEGPGNVSIVGLRGAFAEGAQSGLTTANADSSTITVRVSAGTTLRMNPAVTGGNTSSFGRLTNWTVAGLLEGTRANALDARFDVLGGGTLTHESSFAPRGLTVRDGGIAQVSGGTVLAGSTWSVQTGGSLANGIDLAV